MKVEDLDIGDVVYAAITITDDDDGRRRLNTDDGAPEGEDKNMSRQLAEAGTRGVITMIGHIEDIQPERSVFLVRFEDKKGFDERKLISATR